MSVVDLKKRLQALENASTPDDACRRPFMGAINLLMLLTASHIGGLDSREAVANAYARALGYEAARNFHSVLTAGSGSEAFADLNRRRSDATARLLALKAAPANDGPQVRVALKELFDEMPEHARYHPFVQETGSFDDAVEWLCL